MNRRFPVAILLVCVFLTSPAAKVEAGVNWTMPHPPYPYEAHKKREQGTVYLRLTTDATGKIVKAIIPNSPESTDSPSLRNCAVKYALLNWHGPPNATKETSVAYALR